MPHCCVFCARWCPGLGPGGAKKGWAFQSQLGGGKHRGRRQWLPPGSSRGGVVVCLGQLHHHSSIAERQARRQQPLLLLRPPVPPPALPPRGATGAAAGSGAAAQCSLSRLRLGLGLPLGAPDDTARRLRHCHRLQAPPLCLWHHRGHVQPRSSGQQGKDEEDEGPQRAMQRQEQCVGDGACRNRGGGRMEGAPGLSGRASSGVHMHAWGRAGLKKGGPASSACASVCLEPAACACMCAASRQTQTQTPCVVAAAKAASMHACTASQPANRRLARLACEEEGGGCCRGGGRLGAHGEQLAEQHPEHTRPRNTAGRAGRAGKRAKQEGAWVGRGMVRRQVSRPLLVCC